MHMVRGEEDEELRKTVTYTVGDILRLRYRGCSETITISPAGKSRTTLAKTAYVGFDQLKNIPPGTARPCTLAIDPTVRGGVMLSAFVYSAGVGSILPSLP